MVMIVFQTVHQAQSMLMVSVLNVILPVELVQSLLETVQLALLIMLISCIYLTSTAFQIVPCIPMRMIQIMNAPHVSPHARIA